MNKYCTIEELLHKYRYNKARISFLEKQLERMEAEKHSDYIEYKMFKPGCSGKTPMFVMEKGREVALLNKVEAASQEYRKKCENEFRQAVEETEKEIGYLSFNVLIIEEALAILERINKKYKIVIENYYIKALRMEDIANSIHISRSRCYDMKKEGLRIMGRVIYGEKAVI